MRVLTNDIKDYYLLFWLGYHVLEDRSHGFYYYYFSTCPVGQVTSAVHLPERDFHLPRAIGQPLVSFPNYEVNRLCSGMIVSRSFS